MDEPRTPTPSSSEPPIEQPRLDWTDLRLVALLAVLALGLRAFQLYTTEVTARDSISYIHIAWQLEHCDWRQVLPEAKQHPGYPIAVLVASLPARLLFPGDFAYAMQFSAQFASAAASVLLVAPLFWMGRQLFNRRVAFWAVLVFQCLPCSGRIMADGLSEPLFLLFAATALAFAMHALRSGSVVGFAVAGAAGGLAYLTRPEGLLIPAAAGLTLLGTQAVARWRRPWLTVLASGVVLTTATLVVGGPYMVVIGGVTRKNTADTMIKDVSAEAEPPAGDGVAGGPAVLGVWWRGEADDASGRSGWALLTLGEVLVKAFFFVLWLPALLGLLYFSRCFRTVPGAWMLLLLCGTLGFFLYRVAAKMGYLSDRHTVLILLCGVLWATAALDGAARGLASLLVRSRPALAGAWWANGRAWAVCLLLAVVLGPLARTLEPLHGDRAGFRAAGHWLAENVGPEEGVLDPFGWAGYYAGRYFQPGEVTDAACKYVVLEEGSNQHSHLVTVADAEEAARTGEKKCEFSARRGKDPAKVVIYALQNPWTPKPLPH